MGFGEPLPPQAKMLWVHVLRRAVFDYVLYKGVGRHKLKWQNAYQYIFIPNQEYDEGFSFEEVCESCNWDPDYVRGLTKKLSRTDIKRMETEALKEELNQGPIRPCVRKMLQWRFVRGAFPIYPRMVDEYTPLPETKVVMRETFSQPVPLVRWQAMS